MANSGPNSATPSAPAPAVVTGVQLMQGIGHAPSQGFWADAWSQVRKRPIAMIAMVWISFMVFMAVFGPAIASGHPLLLQLINDAGSVTRSSSPWANQLQAVDIVLLLFGLIALPTLALGLFARGATRRTAWTIFWGTAAALLPAMLTLLLPTVLKTATAPRDLGPFLSWVRSNPNSGVIIASVSAGLVVTLCTLLPLAATWWKRLAVAAVAAGIAVAATGWSWSAPATPNFNYLRQEQAATAKAVYTLVPFSPEQRFSALDRRPPGTTLASGGEVQPNTPGADRTFWLGTDPNGADVLAQLIHAARLSVSIGVVSTGIALLIGVTLGAIMGYFGGWVDLLLYRVVEIFMAVPVLFLLIVTVGVLPPEWKNTYIIMAVVGCFTWTGMARFTRAEFLKLRNQDFVQSAKAAGLPLRSVLFKHMLPNGVAPVLVDTSFAVAAAITLEAVLSYLGLGPVGQASWGKLLSAAVSPEGVFKWWLAVFPGVAIFLTVLSYNLVGEALRDAIDPKLKKARV